MLRSRGTCSRSSPLLRFMKSQSVSNRHSQLLYERINELSCSSQQNFVLSVYHIRKLKLCSVCHDELCSGNYMDQTIYFTGGSDCKPDEYVINWWWVTHFLFSVFIFLERNDVFEVSEQCNKKWYYYQFRPIIFIVLFPVFYDTKGQF